MQIYLDNNATTPTYREVTESMLPFLREGQGNASSLHESGRHCLRAVEEARERVAALIGSAPEEIILTSGGTEANNLAIQGCVREKTDSTHLVTSAIEHHSVLNCVEALARLGAASASYLNCNADGRVTCADVVASLEADTRLVSVMHANNETGVIQPIAEIGTVLRCRDVLFHTDAVQTAGKLDVNVDTLGVDLLSLSAHKFHGPLGAGALYVRNGTKIAALAHGGAQERGLRPGTYNVPAIVGMGVAAHLTRFSLEEDAGYVAALVERLENGIHHIAPDSVVIGKPEQRLVNTIDVCFRGEDNRMVSANLDTLGVAVSVGSACSSGVSEPSHVLRAMGIDAMLAMGAVRFSLGSTNTEQDVDSALAALKRVLGRKGSAPE